jgi:hypothetical protein
MSTYRLYTRGQYLQSLKQCFLTFDLTYIDFRSSPLLNDYVKNCFIDLDGQSLVDYLSSVVRDDSWLIERTSHDLKKYTAKFLWYHYFYAILLRLNNTRIARAEMLDSVKAFHTKQIDIVKRSCEEFE